MNGFDFGFFMVGIILLIELFCYFMSKREEKVNLKKSIEVEEYFRIYYEELREQFRLQREFNKAREVEFTDEDFRIDL
jgi:hypothetical protein